MSRLTTRIVEIDPTRDGVNVFVGTYDGYFGRLGDDHLDRR